MTRTRAFRVGIGAASMAAVASLAATPAFAATSTPSQNPTSASTSPTAGSDDVSGCRAGHLPAAIEGKPAAYQAGLPASAWIWHDKDGYAIRVTHRQDAKVMVFTGSVFADRPIEVKGVQLEKSDHYWFSDDHKTLYFAFTNAGYTDGIDFRADCAAKVTFGVRADATLMPASRVRLGSHAVAAPSNPFTVHRSK